MRREWKNQKINLTGNKMNAMKTKENQRELKGYQMNKNDKLICLVEMKIKIWSNIKE